MQDIGQEAVNMELQHYENRQFMEY